MGTKLDSPPAPEQRWVVAPRGAELVSPGRSPGWENPPIWQPPVSHRPLAATASQGDCKNLPVGPVRHIKWFNCLWRLLSHLNVLKRNKCCFQCSSKGNWAVSRQVVRLEAGYWGQPQVQAMMLPQTSCGLSWTCGCPVPTLLAGKHPDFSLLICFWDGKIIFPYRQIITWGLFSVPSLKMCLWSVFAHRTVLCISQNSNNKWLVNLGDSHSMEEAMGQWFLSKNQQIFSWSRVAQVGIAQTKEQRNQGEGGGLDSTKP